MMISLFRCVVCICERWQGVGSASEERGGALFSYYMGHIGKEKKKKKKVLPINQRVGRHRRRKKEKTRGGRLYLLSS